MSTILPKSYSERNIQPPPLPRSVMQVKHASTSTSEITLYCTMQCQMSKRALYNNNMLLMRQEALQVPKWWHGTYHTMANERKPHNRGTTRLIQQDAGRGIEKLPHSRRVQGHAVLTERQRVPANNVDRTIEGPRQHTKDKLRGEYKSARTDHVATRISAATVRKQAMCYGIYKVTCLVSICLTCMTSSFVSGSNSYSTICSSPPSLAKLGRLLMDVS